MTQSANTARETAATRPMDEQYRSLQVLVGELLKENQELRFKLAGMEDQVNAGNVTANFT
jgi:hypothetical protein